MILRVLGCALFAILCLTQAQAQVPVDAAVPGSANNPSTSPRSYPIIADLQTVKARTPDGKLERFADSANREFTVQYDSEGKVESVGAVRGRHASDVRRITYSPSGQILEVSFGSGYVLYYTYAVDGTQLIRDRFGGVFTRRSDEGSEATSELHSDPAGKLQMAISGLDALLIAATQ
jgi:hypothetical protein